MKSNAIIKENDAAGKLQTTLHSDKFNKLMYVSLAEDVVLLNKYLSKTVVSLKERLKNGIDEITYSDLAEVCLPQIIFFYRKRRGEAAHLKLNQDIEGLTNTPLKNNDIEKSLSKFESELCKNHTKIEKTGKRGSMFLTLPTNN